MDIRQAVGFILNEAKKAGADSAESLGVYSRALSASCRLQKTDSLESEESSGVDVRVFVGKRQAVASCCILEPEYLAKTAQTAVETAKATPPDAYCGLADPDEQATTFPDLDLCDSFAPDTQKLLSLAKEAEQTALDNPAIVNSDGASADYALTQTYRQSTTGFERESARTRFSLSACVLAGGENQSRERDYDYSSATYFEDLRAAKDVGAQAAARAQNRLGAVKIASARMPVVLEQRVARRFFGYFLGAINGMAAVKKTTFLADWLGKAVFAPQISVFEDPFVPRGLASRACDAEGIACQKRRLIENGVLTTWLTDLNAARRLNIAPTGHAGRGFGAMPHASASNVFVSGGQGTFEDLTGSVKRGLFVTDVIGSGLNAVTGDYSQGVSGRLIENGRLTVPVREMTIAGNLKDLFAQMILADDAQDGYAVSVPTALLPDVSVSGK